MVSPDHVPGRDVPCSHAPTFASAAVGAQRYGKRCSPTQALSRKQDLFRKQVLSLTHVQSLKHDAPVVPERQRDRAAEGLKPKKCCRLPLIATSDTTTQRTAEECGRSAAQIAFAARFCSAAKPAKIADVWPRSTRFFTGHWPRSEWLTRPTA